MYNPLKIVYMQKTFYEVSQDWSKAKRPIVKYSTMCAYLLILQKHLVPYFGSMKDITEDVVQQFVMNKLSSGHSKKSVRDMVAVLKSVVKYGRKQKCLLTMIGTSNIPLTQAITACLRYHSKSASVSKAYSSSSQH